MLGINRDTINSLLPRWLLFPAIIFFIFLALTAAGTIIFDKIFQNKIYPNLFVGDLNLGGRTADQAKQLLNREVDQINQRGVVFSYHDLKATVMPVSASAGGDLAYPIINFDADQTAAAALNYGRNDGFLGSLKNKLVLLFASKRLPLSVIVNQAALENILENNLPSVNEPARDAGLIVEYRPAVSAYEFSLEPEKLGKTVDYKQAIEQMLNNLAGLNTEEIKLSTVTAYPKILAKDCLNVSAKAQAVLNAAPLTLSYGENQWAISQAELAAMLSLKLNDSADDKVRVGLDETKFTAYLTEQIAPKIERQPQEAKFQIQNGKVSEFQNGQDGLEVDAAASLAKAEQELFSNGPISLAVKTQPVLVNAGNINDYGIKEVIGVGASNFKGSPANRRHNIKIGAASVNGTLIKPGEEFSLLKILGEVASSTGYLPELVIKEGKTLPEFGGGLCQIGTTVFRATVASGLPVTMRRNHSYRVSYYEPAGTDATIYDPAPDFRFINDMAAYILIQAKFDGDNLSFEFWGARDGRTATSTRPVIYNIVKPEPAKLIETLALKPGQKKCTEKAHNGADAYFDYKVIYPDGAVKEKRFSSHYVPWREVCLLGVEKLSSLSNTTATSTPSAN
ncbi:MAG: VanW family protein [bacterium]|nr:VanW family protein [bacterium]